MSVVDVHHHFVPMELALREGYVPGEATAVMRKGVPAMSLHDGLVDIDLQLADMDTAGVDVSILSSLLGFDADEETCRLVNDSLQALRDRHGERIAGFAHLPLGNVPAATRELDRCINGLGLVGVALPTRVDGRLLDDESLFPVYERAQELGVGIWVHPAMFCDGHVGAIDNQLDRIIGREFDLVTACVRLMAGGVLDRFPELRWVMSHFGGGIAGLYDRLMVKGYRALEGVEKTFHDYWGMLNFDMSGFEGRDAALRAALLVMGPEQLVFGSDYPQDFTGATTDSGAGPRALRDYIARIEALDLDGEPIRGMLGENARQLFQIP